TADAETHDHELVDPQMIHQAELVVGIGFPWAVDLNRPGGLAVGRVTQVCRYTAVLSFELVDRGKGLATLQAPHRRVQPTTREQHQRKAGTSVLIVDPDCAFFVKLSSSLCARLLGKYARRRGGCCCHGSRCEYGASSRSHNRRPPSSFTAIVGRASLPATRNYSIS